MRHQLLIFSTVVLLLATGSASARDPLPADAPGDDGIGRAIALWIPNRVLDVFDLLRVRVRFGPGAASSFRLTEFVSGTGGSYDSLYVGLHGPRGEPSFPSPIGFESYRWETQPASPRASREPYYGRGEVGLGFQLVFLGIDVGADPFEALDLALGVLFIDLAHDDH